jgi:RNA polymerase subunit RPABC4/transcription elongation factor Spt4
MPIWCPDCHAMLIEGTQECPRCGARIRDPQSEETFNRSDIAWFSAYTIAIILIPIIIAIGIAFLCLFLFFR